MPKESIENGHEDDALNAIVGERPQNFEKLLLNRRRRPILPCRDSIGRRRYIAVNRQNRHGTHYLLRFRFVSREQRQTVACRNQGTRKGARGGDDMRRRRGVVFEEAQECVKSRRGRPGDHPIKIK